MAPAIDLTGARVGRLMVLGYSAGKRDRAVSTPGNMKARP